MTVVAPGTAWDKTPGESRMYAQAVRVRAQALGYAMRLLREKILRQMREGEQTRN